jgi:hypothetical protein
MFDLLSEVKTLTKSLLVLENLFIIIKFQGIVSLLLA